MGISAKSRYNPQQCIQTAKGKPFTCNSLGLSDPCNYCKGTSTPIVPVYVPPPIAQEPEPDYYGDHTEILSIVDEWAQVQTV